MDKKLQKEILIVIKKSNENSHEGIKYNSIKNDLWKHNWMQLDGDYSLEKIIQNVRLLVDDKKIDVSSNFFDNSHNHSPGWARLTIKGYEQFDCWYKKIWKFFTNDMAKILSIIATIISIISMLLVIFKK